MSVRSILLLLFVCTLGFLLGQSESQPAFRLVDGLYSSHQELLAGTPSLDWELVGGEMVQLPDDYRLQIAGIHHKGGGLLPDIYAVVLDSFPYRLVREDTQLHYHEFAGLRLAGRYRYYSYEQYEEVSSRMYAYNPANGRPFRQGIVSRKKLVHKQYVMDMATGKNSDFSQAGIADLVSSDLDLVEAIRSIDPEDQALEDKLLQALRVYNKRYPIFPTGF